MVRRSALKSMNINNLVQLIYVIEFKFAHNATIIIRTYKVLDIRSYLK